MIGARRPTVMEKNNIRHITVESVSWRKDQALGLRIAGRWFENAGFQNGDRVNLGKDEVRKT